MPTQPVPPTANPPLGKKAVHLVVGFAALAILGSVGLVALGWGAKKVGVVADKGAAVEATQSELPGEIDLPAARVHPVVAKADTPPVAPTPSADLSSLRDSVAALRDAAAKEKIEGLDAGGLTDLLHRLTAADQEASRLLSTKTEAMGLAQRGWFQVNGKIVTRDRDSVSVWGHAQPTNSDLAQLGTHLDESNLVVMSPDPEGLSSGSYYVGVHSFVRTSTGANALGGTVPISVYGPIAQTAVDRRTDLQREVGELAGLRRDISALVSRERRALVGKKLNATNEATFDQGAAEEFVLQLFATNLDESAFLQSGTSMPWERWKPERRSIAAEKEHQRMMSGVFPASGSVVHLSYSSIAQVARIHAWSQLAGYLPAHLQGLFSGVVDQPVPRGQEGLLNLLTDEKLMASSALSEKFTFKLQQSQRMPELISVEIFANGYSKLGCVALLCLWTGSRTIVLTSTLGGNPEGSFAFDFRTASKDPLAVGE